MASGATLEARLLGSEPPFFFRGARFFFFFSDVKPAGCCVLELLGV
jgi:hypothetical protein